ncbi:MAG: trypsin-like peptidase domain-containing protein [Bacteriovoracaceae bacterium]|nr:trypsin-like peptidase domain-containing protein [Bacteriovoracaceae bacterium]
MIKLATTLFLILSFTLHAEVNDVYGELGMKTVSSSTDIRIQRLGDSVCKLVDKDARGCCSGFFVAEDIIMTNHHCLQCAHVSPKKNQNLGANPLRHLSAIFRAPKPTAYRSFEDLNKHSRGFNYINVETQKSPGHESLRIKKILAGSKNLDYLLLKVEKPKYKVNTLTLGTSDVKMEQKLISLSYPQIGQFAGLKVYDNTDECRVYRHFIYSAPNGFAHQCDTEPGSSGSPIFDRITGKAIGLHKHGGARSKYWEPHDEIAPVFLEEDLVEKEPYERTSNGASLMKDIVSHLQKNNPELLKKLKIK